jgi:hypothetical protein
MAKKVTGFIKLHIPPERRRRRPRGPALGQHGVNIMDFCKNFNARTAKGEGMLTPVVITVYQDRSYTFITKTPPPACSWPRRPRSKRDRGSEQEQGRQGHQGSGLGDRQDEAPGLELRHAGSGHPNRRGQRALDGHRSRLNATRGVSNMPKHGKKYTGAAKKVANRVPHGSGSRRDDASAVFVKFDETVELAMRLGVDPKHADQMVRGTVVLPHGGGKTKRVAVIAAGEKLKEATRPAPITSAERIS